MPDDILSPLENENKPKKRVVRKRKPAIKKVASAEPPEDPRIGEYLTNIYRDTNGNLPDMRRIAVKKNGSFLRSLTSLIVTLAVLVGLGWFGYFWWSGLNKNTNPVATVSITGPEHVTLGTTSTYVIVAQNTSDTAITKATLQVFYPAGFVYQTSDPAATNVGHNEWDIGALAAHTKKSITVSGQNYGTVDSDGSWRAFLTYQPVNFNSTLQQSASLSTTIDTSPFELSVSGPGQVTPGADAVFTFTLKNTGQWQPASLYLTPALPANFVVTTSSPALDSHTRWVVTPSTSSSTVLISTYTVRGSLTKSVDDTMPFGAALTIPLGANNQLYELAHASISPTVIKNGLALNVAVNGNMSDGYTHPGDTLNVTILAKNTGSSDIKNATVKINFDAPSVKNQSMLAWNNLVDKNDGDVKGQQISPTLRRGTITWTAKQVASLAKLKPNDEVQIDMQLPIKTVKDFDISNLTASSSVVLAASVSYTDASSTARTIAAAPLTLIFNSDTAIEAHDAVSGNAHTITWVLNNTLHTLKNIQVSATAYGDIAFAADKPDGGTLVYDASGKTITWKIDALPDSVDVLTAPFTLTLNKVDPSQNILVGKIHLTATDSVTNQPIDLTADDISLK